jgi:Rab proteins geranylgeranyltransferase component A
MSGGEHQEDHQENKEERPASWLDDPAFDAIVVGQELPTAVFAAAVARSGRSVLHLDPAEFYGGPQATLDLPAFDALLRGGPPPDEVTETAARGDTAQGDAGVRVGGGSRGAGIGVDVSDAEIFVEGTRVHPAASEQPEEKEEEEKEESEEKGVSSSRPVGLGELEDRARRVSLDVGGRVFFATGELIDLLVQSTVAKYLDFKVVDAGYLWHADAPQLVPGSRADVFRNRYISLVEKRVLSKFMATLQQAPSAGPDGSEAEGDASETVPAADESFDTFLQSQRLTPKLRDFVKFAIALLRDGDERADFGMAELRLFVRSLGRFDTHTPFIALMYGVGELVQAFARMSAVFGCLCILRRGIETIFPPQAGGDSTSAPTGRIRDTEGQILESPCVVFSASTAPREWTRVVRLCARGAIVCQGPLLRDTSENADESSDTTNKTGNCVLVFPPGSVSATADDSSGSPRDIANASAIHVMQVGDDMGTSPDGVFTLHLTLVADPSASGLELRAILRAAVTSLGRWMTEASDVPPRLLYEAYWIQRERMAIAEAVPAGFAVLDDIDSSQIHLERCADQARDLFRTTFGEEEDFLPAAPAPEDIVWEEDSSAQDGPREPDSAGADPGSSLEEKGSEPANDS